MQHASKLLNLSLLFLAPFSVGCGVILVTKTNMETKETKGEAAASHIFFPSDKT